MSSRGKDKVLGARIEGSVPLKTLLKMLWGEEPIYQAIVANISNAVNVSTMSALWRKQPIEDRIFGLDEVFSEETLPIDAYLNQTSING